MAACGAITFQENWSSLGLMYTLGVVHILKLENPPTLASCFSELASIQVWAHWKSPQNMIKLLSPFHRV